MSGWCGCIFKNYRECMILVIAEPSYSSYFYKIVDRYTLLVLYEDHIRRSTMDAAQQAGQDKALEMGFTEEP